MTTQRAMAVIILIAATVMVACGGGSQRADTEAALKAAVKAESEAIYRQDVRASYEGYAKACREQVGLDEWSRSLMAGMALFEGMMKVKFAELKVDEVEVRDFTATTAEAAVVVSAHGTVIDRQPKFQPYAYEDGRWLATNCAGMKFGSR